MQTDYLSQQHLERYRFAVANLKPEQLVLDIACGSGYGTTMLREHGCTVIGGDADIPELNRLHSDKNINGLVALDGLSLPFPDNTFDAVVTFETVEHVVDGLAFLSEMKRVLKTGGTCITSTPNIAYTSHPRFHLKEYKPEEYYSLVSSLFSKTDRFGQYFTVSDRVHDKIAWTSFRVMWPVRAIKRTIRKLSKTPVSNTARNSLAIENKRINVHSDPYYKVRLVNTPTLLRIMVTVSTK